VPPFSACTRLDVRASLAADDSMVTPVLLAAADLTALRHINLEVSMPPRCKLTTQGIDARMGTVIGAVPATLPNLGSMYLHVPAFGAHCARNLAGLVQLTAICVQPSTGDPVESTAATADLTPLSRLTNLRELQLCGPPPVQPAAGVNGPFSLPSSLTRLVWAKGVNRHAVIGCWVTHLAACPGLQELVVTYTHREHSSAHPALLVPILAQHNRHLRSLSFDQGGAFFCAWDAPVAGLLDRTTPPVWCPDAALAALTGLESLVAAAGPSLFIESAAAWQHLTQLCALTRLTGACVRVAASQLEGALPALVDLACGVFLTGRGLGELLLACPQLVRAVIQVFGQGLPASPAVMPLRQHASLKLLGVCWCSLWGAAAAAHSDQLAPVLSGVACLHLRNWPRISDPDTGSCMLPDLSQCTALNVLELGLNAEGPSLEQEDILLMLEPATQLRQLIVWNARELTARAVVPLQYMLPQLQCVVLRQCGQVRPDPARTPLQQQQEEGVAAAQAEQHQDRLAQQLLATVRRQLRPDLVLELLACT
jgi:hypothetical protein